MTPAEPRVTVAIPVGPYPANQRWLHEAIASVFAQTHKVDEIKLILDMAKEPLNINAEDDSYPPLSIYRSPWRLGVATAFNFGVALARNDLVFLLGSDDWLEPTCIEECVDAYSKVGRPEGKYFSVGVRYSDDREDKDQYTPCGAAMVSKALWQRTGGFPLETASGASDAALISIFLGNKDAGTWHVVNPNRPLYNYRVHDGTDTAHRAAWQGVILQTRDLLTSGWKKPEWT